MYEHEIFKSKNEPNNDKQLWLDISGDTPVLKYYSNAGTWDAITTASGKVIEETAKLAAENATADVKELLEDLAESGTIEEATLAKYVTLSQDVTEVKATTTELELEIGSVNVEKKGLGYFDITGGIGTVIDIDNPLSNTKIYYAIEECTEGDVFCINGSSGSTSIYLYAFLDSSKSIISYTTSYQESNWTIEAPENAKYFIANLAKSATVVFTDKNAISIDKAEKSTVDTISKELAVAKSVTDAVSEGMQYGYKTLEINTESYLITTKFLLVNKNYSHVKYNVHAGEKYKISGIGLNETYPLYIYAKDAIYVDSDGSAYSRETIVTDLEITIPDGVNTLYVNGKNDGSGIIVIKQYLPISTDFDKKNIYGNFDYEKETYLIQSDGVTKVNANCRHAEISVVAGEKYAICGHYYGGNYPAYIYMQNDSVVSAQTADTYFIGLKIEIPSGVDKLIVNGDSSGRGELNIYKYESVSRKYGDEIIVGKDGECYYYTDINDAVCANSGNVVNVSYGTFDDTCVHGRNTDKYIIGKDRDLCILKNTTGNYETPPIEIAGGVIKNLTIIADGTGTSNEHKSYCVHSDDDACANKKLIIENCLLNSIENHHTAGIGVRDGEELIFKNCYFRQDSADYYCMFAHTADASTAKATIRFINCYFSAVGKVLKFKWWESNCSLDFEFINCTVVSDTLGISNDSVFLCHSDSEVQDTTWNNKFTLLSTSHGNNIPLLNAE